MITTCQPGLPPGSAVYLDNMATTPVDPAVLDAMVPCYQELFGNASSAHRYGRAARDLVEAARAQIASTLNASPEEIVFTSGATESDNLALKGAAEWRGPGQCHIITAATEHKAVLDTCIYLSQQGSQVTTLPVDHNGMIDPDDLRRAITDRTALVSVMLANNEIGVVQPVKELAQIATDHGVLFHTDAAQAFGKLPIDVRELGVDLMSITAHKIYGPKGIGALYVRGGTSILEAQMHGGGHERNMRSGTLNVAGIVGLGKAAELAVMGLHEESTRLRALRNRLRDALLDHLPELLVNGDEEKRLPGNLNIQFAGIDGEALMAAIPEIAVSSGAACTAAELKPSYVLKALGLSDQQARSSIRFGIGRFNTGAEIDYAADRVVTEVRRLREISPLWDPA